MAPPRALPLAVAGLVLQGCAVADQYGPRAIAYNVEANDARSELILRNIVRAAYREPLQFSEVTSVTGIASAGGTLGASVPVIGTGASFSPQFTASGGPNFSFANLSTQEFYQASSSEIDNKTISLMLNQGFSPQVVFPLLISDITISDGQSIRRVRMDVDNDKQFFYSFTAITGLIKQGLTAKSIDSDSQIGPDLSKADAKIAANNILRAEDITKEPDLTATSGGTYKLLQSGKKIVLCFDPSLFEQDNSESTNDTNKTVVPLKGERTVYLAVKNGRGDPDFTITLPDDYRCGVDRRKAASPASTPPRKPLSLVFRMRSLQGIYEYVGSLVRIELGLSAPAKALAIPGNGRPTVLFDIRRGGAGAGGVATSTAFGDFSVEPDPAGFDLSFSVLKAIGFLQALNSKATTLPAPVTTSVLVR